MVLNQIGKNKTKIAVNNQGKIKSLFQSINLYMKKKYFILALILNLICVNFASAQPTEENKTKFEPNVDLISPDTAVDYNQLALFLSKGEWRKANDETLDSLLQATGRKSIGWADVDSIKSLACWDLKTVDNLWRQYSNNKFGFSVQLPIYLETGNKPGRLITDDAYNKFGDRLGWREKSQNREGRDWIIFIENLNYNIDAPMGHLPYPRPEYSITGARLQYSALAQRMVQCNITGN